MSWRQLYETAPPAGGPGTQRLNWTRAIVRNKLYLHRQDNPFILELDTTTTPGSPTIIEQTPTFINMAGVQGIAEGRSRLVAWDIANSIYWSSIDDPLDFEPSLATTANVVQVDAIKGRIVHVLGTNDGFIIYTTSNIVTARYSAGASEIATEVFRFEELSDTLGIFTSDHVTIADRGFHHVWTQGGLYRINADLSPGSPLVEPIFPQVSDFIRQFKGYPRLSHHRDRFFAIWLTYRDGAEGRNIFTRFPYDRRVWYNEPYVNNFKFEIQRDNWNIDFMLNGNDTPESYISPRSVGPRTNVDCTKDTLPWRDCPNVLWGAYILVRPPIKIELKDLSVEESWGVDLGTLNRIRIEGARRYWYEISPTTYEDYEVIFVPSRGFRLGSPSLAFSFGPLSLMYQQYIQWLKEKDENRENASGIFDGITGIQLTGLEHIIGNVQAMEDVMTIPNPNPGSVKFPKQRVWCTKEDSPEEYPDEKEYWRFTAFVETTTPSEITTQSAWLDVQKDERLYELGPPVGDEDWQFIGTDTTNRNDNAWEYLNGVNLAWEGPIEPLTFPFAFGENSEEFLNRRPVRTLARYYPTSDPELFTTARAIWGQTDMCTYASLASFADRRAFCTFERFKEDEYQRDVPVENGWNREFRFDHEFSYEDYDVDTNDSTENSPKGYADLGLIQVPRHRLFKVHPLAVFTDRDGDPSAELGKNLAVARSEYADRGEIGGLLQAYADAGWTVGQPPTLMVDPPFVDPVVADNDPTSGSPATNVMNGVEDSGLFEELTEFATVCGRPIDPVENSPVVIPAEAQPKQHVRPPPTPADVGEPPNIFTPDGWQDMVPSVIDLTGVAGQGPIYPVYSKALVFDQHLERWGTCDELFYIFLDYNPVNAIAYDPVSDTAISSFTYDNFLSSLGAVLTNRMLHLFDRNPELSYAVYGKIGYRRRRRTRLFEVRAETLDRPSAFIIVEPSLDGKFINPYGVRMKQLEGPHDVGHIDVMGQWFNLVIYGGRYEIIRLETTGRSAGER